jgi:hypothetical protein
MIVLSQNGSSSLWMFPVIRFRERRLFSYFLTDSFCGSSISLSPVRVGGSHFRARIKVGGPWAVITLAIEGIAQHFWKPPAHRIENAHDVIVLNAYHHHHHHHLKKKKKRNFEFAPRVSYYYLFGCVLYQRKRWRIKSISLVQFVKCFVSPLGYLLTNITCTASTKQQSSACIIRGFHHPI